MPRFAANLSLTPLEPIKSETPASLPRDEAHLQNTNTEQTPHLNLTNLETSKVPDCKFLNKYFNYQYLDFVVGRNHNILCRLVLQLTLFNILFKNIIILYLNS